MSSGTPTSSTSLNADLSWLPSDADEQLSLSFRIISNAYRTRVNSLEADLRAARVLSQEKGEQCAALQKKSSSLEVQLIESTQRGNQLNDENKKLIATIQKLQKDNNRLESLKKAVLTSIQDDHTEDLEDAIKSYKHEDVLEKEAPRTMQEIRGNDYGSIMLPCSASLSSASSSSSSWSSSSFAALSEQHINSQTNSANLSSPNERSLDGKAFFRAVRNLLPHDQFNQFLANIKKLNNHQITPDEALRQAQIIFGESGADLFRDFRQMLVRHG